MDISANTLMCAGILPFFDSGKTVLLGMEFRKRYNTHAWMEFGGKQESGESLAVAAWREFTEETAGTIKISLASVEAAEEFNHYVDHYNSQTKTFYRMYCLKLDQNKPASELFKQNAAGQEHVEKVDWQYFNSRDVIDSEDGTLPNTEVRLYSTMLARLAKLRTASFLKDFVLN